MIKFGTGGWRAIIGEDFTKANIQIFANTVTNQDLEMIPLSELPSQWSKYEQFDTPPQQL